jgi:chemotaxis methyl-accepting protein methylase
MRGLAAQASHGSSMDIAVFACSKSAEVYSIACTLKAARRDLTINLRAIDLSREIVEFAKQGVYSLQDPDFRGIEDHKGLSINKVASYVISRLVCFGTMV